MKRTAAQIAVGTWLTELGYAVAYEHRFCERQWRFDVAIPDARVAIECNGHFQGRHGAGWSNDAEKLNTAQMAGWRVLVFSNQDVLKSTRAYDFIRQYFA